MEITSIHKYIKKTPVLCGKITTTKQQPQKQVLCVYKNKSPTQSSLCGTKTTTKPTPVFCVVKHATLRHTDTHTPPPPQKKNQIKSNQEVDKEKTESQSIHYISLFFDSFVCLLNPPPLKNKTEKQTKTKQKNPTKQKQNHTTPWHLLSGSEKQGPDHDPLQRCNVSKLRAGPKGPSQDFKFYQHSYSTADVTEQAGWHSLWPSLHFLSSPQ